MSALDELLKDISHYDEVDLVNHLLHWRKPAADEFAALKARVKQAEENWHKNEARVAKLHSLLSRCVERVEFAAECDADGANGDEELLRYIHAALKGAE